MLPENQSELFKDLSFDETAKEHIRSAASWAMIIVVIAVIGYALSIVELLMVKDSPVVRTEGFNYNLGLTEPSLTSSIFTIAIGLLINFFLFRFATLAKSGVNGLNQDNLNRSFNNLKFYFVITSIIMVIFMVVFVLAALFVGTKGVDAI